MTVSVPQVSVVLPTRDRAGLLSRAIESVLDQTFQELELIVVDDASRDDSAATLERYAAADARIRVQRMEAPVGAAAARNVGIWLGRGAYVAFIDDDAEYLPRKLERQVSALLAEPQCGLVYCAAVYVGPDGRRHVLGSREAAGPSGRRRLLRRNSIDTSAVLVRREILNAAGGFDERLPRLQDWDLWLRLSLVTTFHFVRTPLVRTYFTAGGISTRGDALVVAASILVEKLENRPDLGRGALADGLTALGHDLLIHGAPSEGRALLRRSVRLSPWSAKRLVKVLLATLGVSAYAAGIHLWERMWSRSMTGIGCPRADR